MFTELFSGEQRRSRREAAGAPGLLPGREEDWRIMDMDNMSAIGCAGTWLKKSKRFLLYLFLQLIFMTVARIIMLYI